jgi:hypothetical protein
MLRNEVRGHAGNLVRGLADDLDVADNRILHLRICRNASMPRNG